MKDMSASGENDPSKVFQTSALSFRPVPRVMSGAMSKAAIKTTELISRKITDEIPKNSHCF